MNSRAKVLLGVGATLAVVGIYLLRKANAPPKLAISVAPPSVAPPQSNGQPGEVLAPAKIILGVTPKDGVSTDDLVTTLQSLNQNGLCGYAASNAAATYSFTRSGSGFVVMTATWNISAYPSKSQLIIMCIRSAFADLAVGSPSVAFSSAAVAVAP